MKCVHTGNTCIFYTREQGLELQELIAAEICEHCKTRVLSVPSEHLLERPSQNRIFVKHIAQAIPHAQVSDSDRDCAIELIREKGDSFGRVIRVHDCISSTHKAFVVLKNAMLYCSECGISRRQTLFICDYNLLTNYVIARDFEVRGGFALYSSTCQPCLAKKAISIKE